MQALQEREELLVARTQHTDIGDRGDAKQWPSFYLLWPAGDCNSMLAKR